MMEIKILPVRFMLYLGNAKVILQERRLRLAGKKKIKQRVFKYHITSE